MAEASHESEQKSSKSGSGGAILSTQGMKKQLLKGLDIEPGLLDESCTDNQSVHVEHEELGTPGVKKISMK